MIEKRGKEIAIAVQAQLRPVWTPQRGTLGVWCIARNNTRIATKTNAGKFGVHPGERRIMQEQAMLYIAQRRVPPAECMLPVLATADLITPFH